MPIDVDAIQPARRSIDVDSVASPPKKPKEKSFLGKLLTGPREFLGGLPEAGLQTIQSVGGNAAPVEAQPFLGRVGLGAIGLGRGIAEFPFRAAQAAGQGLPSSLGGPEHPTAEPLKEVTGVSEFEKFAKEPSIEQGSRAATVLAQYLAPAAIKAFKGKTVATDLKALAKPEVRAQLPIQEEPVVYSETKIPKSRMEELPPPPKFEQVKGKKGLPEERRQKNTGPPISEAERRAVTPEMLKSEPRPGEGEFISNKPTLPIEKPAEPVAPGEPPPPKPPQPVAEGAPEMPKGEPIVNPKVFGELDAPTRKFIEESSAQLRPEAEKIKNGPLTNEEVSARAAEVSAISEVMTREQQLELAARTERLRLDVEKLAEGKALTPEYLDALKKWVDSGTAVGRLQQARKIGYTSEGGETSLPQIKNKLVKQLMDAGHSAEELLRESKDVDFTNAAQVAKFARKYMSWWEKVKWDVDTFRYGNMLSGPGTHIINTFTNALQIGGLRPATIAVKSIFDPKTFVSQVPAYLKGATQALGTATKEAGQVMRGERVLGRPDIRYLPNPNPVLKAHTFILEAMEASDIFFRRLAEGGTEASLRQQAAKLGKPVLKNIETMAMEEAGESIFRKPLDPSNKTGQGHFNSALDRIASAVELFRKVPGQKWTIPFLLTVHNLFKQGLQYSPVGALNIPGAADKAEMIARSLIGSTVMGTVMGLIRSGAIKTTWKAPSDKKQRELFFAEGNLPFQIQIGDKFRFQYSRIGPLAYPIAMAAAIKYYTEQNPDRFDETTEKRFTNILMGSAEFFANQLYLDQIQNIIEAVKGDESKMAAMVSNYPRQAVPFGSFLSWVDRMVDTTYRKPGKEFNYESIIQNLKRQLPYFSEQVEPYTQPAPSPFAPDITATRQFPVLNAVSPFSITERRPEYTPFLERRQEQLEKKAKKRGKKREANALR